MGYVAGENAARVQWAEGQVFSAIEGFGTREDAKQIVRALRTQHRVSRFARHLLSERISRSITRDEFGPVSRTLGAAWEVFRAPVFVQAARLKSARWRVHTDYQLRRLHPRPSNLYVLAWWATSPPWPHARADRRV